MQRTPAIRAIVAITTLACGTIAFSAASQAQSTPPAPAVTWGVFREIVPSAATSTENCWTQAMISGATINGDVLSTETTPDLAAADLAQDQLVGLCAPASTN